MSEETLLIFKMLQDGKLTPEQAEALLKAIPTEEKPAAAPPPEPEGLDEVQRKLAELQKRLAELQHNIGAAQGGMIDKLRSQIGDLNLKPVLDDATRTLGAVKTEVVRNAKLAARVAERQTRKLRTEAKHVGRRLMDECRVELSHGNRPVNISGVPESVDIVNASSLVTAGTHIAIVNPLGNVRVVKSAKNAVTVKATKTAWSSSSEIRGNRLKSVRIAGPERESGLTGLSVYVVPETPGLRDITVDLEVAVPAGVRIGIETGFGDISVEGVNAVIDKMESLSGAVTVKGLRQPSDDHPTKLRVHSGRLEVTDFEGSSLDAQSASGDIHVELLTTGSLKIRTGRGNVAVKGCKGADAVNIHSGAGDTVVTDIETTGSVQLNAASGDVTASNIDAGSITISTFSGDIEIDRIDTADKLALSTFSGAVNAREVLSDQVTVGTVSGDATLHFSDPVIRSLGASTVSGDLTVTLTGETGAHVELRTQSGKLISQLPLETKSDAGFAVLTGVIGDGKGAIKMQSASGDLTIN